VKLSEITTADQLVLTLARQRYTKVSDRAEAEVLFEQGVAGIYAFGEIWWPKLGNWIRQLDVMPQAAENSGFGGLSACLDAHGNITEWFTWESFAGTTVTVAPNTDLNSAIRAVAHFLRETV
jgi:hypothetical protein